MFAEKLGSTELARQQKVRLICDDKRFSLSPSLLTTPARFSTVAMFTKFIYLGRHLLRMFATMIA